MDQSEGNKEGRQEFILTEEELEELQSKDREYLQTGFKNLYQIVSMFVESVISDPAKFEAFREHCSPPNIPHLENSQENLHKVYLPDIQTTEQNRKSFGALLAFLLDEIEKHVIEFFLVDDEEGECECREDKEDCYDDEDNVELKN